MRLYTFYVGRIKYVIDLSRIAFIGSWADGNARETQGWVSFTGSVEDDHTISLTASTLDELEAAWTAYMEATR